MRDEIRHGLKAKLHVVPLLLSGTPPPKREALRNGSRPASLSEF